jgi:hypothetical protein
MLELIVDKPYSEYLKLFYERYDESYCETNKLFIVKNKKGEVTQITRPLVDYADEIVSTDYILITGTKMHIESENQKVAELLNEYMSTAEFNNVWNLYVLQGLILGDTFLKFAIDDEGVPVLSVARLDNAVIKYVPTFNTVSMWIVEYKAYNEQGEVVYVREEYSKDRIRILIDDEVVKDIDNPYGDFWFIHVINKPSLRNNFFGESELNIVYKTIDEINSTLSRMSAIEDIYANPKLVVSGLRDTNSLKKEENLWAINENASISILEYKGDILPSMLEKVKFLEDYLKSKNPELMLSHVKESTGYALKLKLLKLVKKIETYRKNYFTGLKRALKLILKYYGIEDDFKIVTDEIIPNDVLEDVQKFAQLKNMGIISKRTIAERLDINYDLEQKRIKKEEANEANEIVINVGRKSKRGNPGKPEVRTDETV